MTFQRFKLWISLFYRLNLTYILYFSRVMSSLDWGPTATGGLWLDQQVHLVAAEAIVKGHIAQCKAQNGLIAASVKKVAKMASRVPDYEQQFDAFCWDILLRLKLDVLVSAHYRIEDIINYSRRSWETGCLKYQM